MKVFGQTIAILWGALLCMLTVSCKDSEPEWDATGIFESTEITVSAEANGRILSFGIHEGEEVSAGRIVGCIDTVQLVLQREQLLARIEAAGANYTDIVKQVAATRRQIEQAEKEVMRTEKLLADHAGTQKQYDDATAQLAVLRRTLDARQTALQRGNKGVEAEQKALHLQVLQLEDMLEKCRISSPVSGTVLAKYAESGEVTAAGRPLFKVADMKNLFLRAYVESSLLNEIKLGQKVIVYADKEKDAYRTYEGKVAWISSEAEFTPKTIQTRDERAHLVYAVKIAVTNTDGRIKLGMYGNVRF